MRSIFGVFVLRWGRTRKVFARYSFFLFRNVCTLKRHAAFISKEGEVFMQQIMDAIAKGNSAVNNIVWGIPMLALLVGTGILLTILTRGFQFRRFGYTMRNTIGKMFQKQEAGKGEVTPFQAVTTALAATVGTGNISGVIAAVTLGGPGSIFWLWVTALFGMCTKFAEATLAVKYRERNKHGDWVGGPMYYIKNGLGKKWNWLGVVFCVFGALAAFGIGNAVQVGNIIDSINAAIVAFHPNAEAVNFDTLNLIIGIVIAIIVGVTVIGGIKRLGLVAERLVPFMSIIYILSCFVVIIFNIKNIGHVFAMIFEGAFSPSAIVGATVGVTIRTCITWGVKRGVFSNEAGLGSAPIAHAASSEKDPVHQGLYGIFEVFMDTIVICSLTGITLLISGVDFEYGVKGGNDLMVRAFGTVMGDKIGSIIIAVGISLFALSTVLSWALYGTRCCEYIFGHKSIRLYQIVFVLICIVGATMNLSLAWDIADTLNGLMALPNLVALVGLSGVVMRLTQDHLKQKNRDLT